MASKLRLGSALPGRASGSTWHMSALRAAQVSGAHSVCQGPETRKENRAQKELSKKLGLRKRNFRKRPLYFIGVFATQSSQSQCYDAMATFVVDPGPACAPGPPSSAGLVAGACLPAAAAAPLSPGSQTDHASSNGWRRCWRARQISGITGLLLRAPTLSRIVIGEIRCS